MQWMNAQLAATHIAHEAIERSCALETRVLSHVKVKHLSNRIGRTAGAFRGELFDAVRMGGITIRKRFRYAVAHLNSSRFYSSLFCRHIKLVILHKILGNISCIVLVFEDVIRPMAVPPRRPECMRSVAIACQMGRTLQITLCLNVQH